MNTLPQQALKPSTAQRLAALALSCVFTVCMLVGVNQIAVSDAPAGLLAQVGHSHG